MGVRTEKALIKTFANSLIAAQIFPLMLASFAAEKWMD